MAVGDPEQPDLRPATDPVTGEQLDEHELKRRFPGPIRSRPEHGERTAFGRLAAAAASGHRVSKDDIDAVVPPPGRDAGEFRREVYEFAKHIEQVRGGAGELGRAQRLAESATTRYESRFTDDDRDAPVEQLPDPEQLAQQIFRHTGQA